MIEEVGSAYVFLSILALIVIEISSVLRKIDLEDEVEVPGLLPPVFPKMFRECSLFGRFGFLHWVSHLILVLGYFIFTGMGMFGLSLIFSLFDDYSRHCVGNISPARGHQYLWENA